MAITAKKIGVLSMVTLYTQSHHGSLGILVKLYKESHHRSSGISANLTYVLIGSTFSQSIKGIDNINISYTTH